MGNGSIESAGNTQVLSEDDLAQQTADWEGMAQQVEPEIIDEELVEALIEDMRSGMTPG